MFCSCPTRFYYSTAILDRKVPHFSYLEIPGFFIGPLLSWTVMYLDEIHIPNPSHQSQNPYLGVTVVEHIPRNMPETRATPDLSYMFYDVRIFNFSTVLSSYSSVPWGKYSSAPRRMHGPHRTLLLYPTSTRGHAGPYCTYRLRWRHIVRTRSLFPTFAVIFNFTHVAVRVPVFRSPRPKSDPRRSR